MVGCIVLLFLVGLEVCCVSIGTGLFEAQVSREIHRLWLQAVWSIPLTGLAAIWAMGRRVREPSAPTAIIVALAGASSTLYWIWQVADNRFVSSRFEGSLIASLAVAPSLLLLSAGVACLFTRRAIGR